MSAAGEDWRATILLAMDDRAYNSTCPRSRYPSPLFVVASSRSISGIHCFLMRLLSP